MNEMRIEAEVAGTAGIIEPLAEHLMDQAFAFFRDEENEKEYQKWRKQREKILRCAQNDGKERSA